MAGNERDFQMIKEKAEEWTREAGGYIKEQMKLTFKVNTKSHQHDLVTDVDKGVEAFFQEKIDKEFPGHRLMGEEGSFENVKDLSGTVWILDPIDGTVNFVHQESYFAISAGVFHNGEPVIGIVYDVMHDELFSSLKGKGAELNNRRLSPLSENSLNEAIISFNTGWLLKDRRLERIVKRSRGTRSYGAAALEIAYVAAGRLDAYISFNLAPWDIAGGYALLQEVGGKATNYDGKTLNFLEKTTLIAANPWVYDEIIEVLNTNTN
ncbi:inositol monophosphatase family protein [Salipaludibacillus sp. CUR1]|uniref:inositol monophosphatase family protein n=1 Tax=Salipaludibacillus sp. CUR1 TaxID=2820003 RepID=UPI001E539BAF|nr:inositol monophosphatase family protein [Salipaludibacillus sp. CUR1]MCE7794750.1 inositol monophosphatase family protein [Salipaludibacillus sp. CUR1]